MPEARVQLGKGRCPRCGSVGVDATAGEPGLLIASLAADVFEQLDFRRGGRRGFEDFEVNSRGR